MTRRGDRDLRGPVDAAAWRRRGAPTSTLCMSDEEAAKHGVDGRAASTCARSAHEVDLCIVLGGDGTILGALREYAGTDVPVFAVNFGEVGFLATMDPEGIGEGLELAFRGEFDTMAMPAVTVGRPDDSWVAFNDISVHRQPGKRVADLAYAIGGEEIGRVRCDGLVVSTPAGLDGLQPRQRRPRAGLGRGGLRRLLHRAALLHRARAGRGARTTP